MSNTRDWKVTWTGDFRTGRYFALNVAALGGAGKSTVVVKGRALPGPAYWCASCNLNSCPHTEWIAEQDTPDTEAA